MARGVMWHMWLDGTRTWSWFDKWSRMTKMVASNWLIHYDRTCTSTMAIVFVRVVTFRFCKMRVCRGLMLRRHQIRRNVVLEEVMMRHRLKWKIHDSKIVSNSIWNVILTIRILMDKKLALYMTYVSVFVFHWMISSPTMGFVCGCCSHSYIICTGFSIVTIFFIRCVTLLRIMRWWVFGLK